MKPYLVRMFADVGCDFALWGEMDEGPPTTNGNDSTALLEQRLPISSNLRDRILSWAHQHYRYDAGERQINMDDFDERGVMLSRELQRELGPLYRVRYSFNFAGSRERLLPLFADDECPGWSAK